MIKILSIIGVVVGALIFVARPRGAIVGGDPVIEDLGTLGGDSSFGSGINNSGTVTGSSFLPGGGSKTHAFRYVDGQGMVDVGTLAPGGISLAMRINNGGLICGGAASIEDINRAFIASAALNLTDLSDGLDDSWAWDVNDRGQIIGEGRGEIDSPPRAMLWTLGEERQELGTLGGTSSFSRGHCINEDGQVAGDSGTVDNFTRLAFRYTPGVGMVSLGTLGGARSRAWGINDGGQVVGESETVEVHDSKRFLLVGTTQPTTHAFLWTEGAGMIDLGALSLSPSIFGGGNSVAWAINNNGVVVGHSTLSPMDGVTTHAFRWTKEEGMIDLNSLLPSRSGWVLQQASDINDKGAITGQGLHNGKKRAFRMFHHPVGVFQP